MLSFDFSPYVASYLPGCPSTMINRAALQAADTFCRLSLWWRNDLDPVPCVDGTADYDLVLPANTTVVQVREILYGTQPVRPANVQTLNREYIGWKDATGPQPRYFFRPTLTSIQLVPVPTQQASSEDLNIRVSITPTLDASGVDPDLATEWLETIKAGILERLLAIPGKPWSNPGLVPIFHSQFRGGISEAKLQVMRDRGESDMLPRYDFVNYFTW